MQAGNEGKQGIAAVAGFFGLQGGEPSALLLVQATHEEVNLMMKLSIQVIVPAAAVGAGAYMNDAVSHDDFSAKQRSELRRTLY